MSQASNKFGITNEIRAILLEASAVSAMVDDKIFPLVAPKDTTGDFIIYQRDEYSIDRAKMGIVTQKCRVYINVVSDDYDRGQQLAAAIFEALEGDLTDPDMRIRLEDSTEDYESGKYIQILLFSIE